MKLCLNWYEINLRIFSGITILKLNCDVVLLESYFAAQDVQDLDHNMFK